MSPWTMNDGGRKAAGFRGETNDCVTRAIAIAGRLDYREVYDGLHAAIRSQRLISDRGKSPRDGVPKKVIHRYPTERGWTWTPTMSIGSGTKVHLRAEDLPTGRIVVQASKHVVAVIDGVMHDTHDPSRDGTRCVYGYWTAP